MINLVAETHYGVGPNGWAPDCAELARPCHRVVVRRSGEWWAISVPKIVGVHSQAGHIDEVEVAARDALALFLDVPPSSFDVEIEIKRDEL